MSQSYKQTKNTKRHQIATQGALVRLDLTDQTQRWVRAFHQGKIKE